MIKFSLKIVFAVSLGIVMMSGGCTTNQDLNYQQNIDSLRKMVVHAEQNLAIDPVLLKKRTDTMGAVMYLVDSVMPYLDKKDNEVALAYLIYKEAYLIFTSYLKAHDAMAFEIQQLNLQLAELDAKNKSLNKAGKQAFEVELRSTKEKCIRVYSESKVLIRSYIDVIRPYQRKKKIVQHLFDGLVENKY